MSLDKSSVSEEKKIVVGVIPSRWGSTRFPGKPLHDIAGKPLIQHVWEKTKKTQHLDHIFIATDDTRIFKEAKNFGAKVVMTSKEHLSGSDRIAEVVSKIPQADFVINIQGDEPLIEPELIDKLITKIINVEKEETISNQCENQIYMATVVCPIKAKSKQYNDENCVKVVIADNSQAIYFSRAPIPFLLKEKSYNEGISIYQHVGIYAYTREALLQFVSLKPAPIEIAESLEQLRAIFYQIPIYTISTKNHIPGVDTLEQAHAIEKVIMEKK